MDTLIETPELDKISLPAWIKVTQYSLLEQADLDKLIANHVWVTLAKKKIKVRDMATSHIIACIRCWNGIGKTRIPARYLGGKDKWLQIFNWELLQRQ